MKLKPGISIVGLKPEALLGIQIAATVFGELSETLTVTSCTDGTHGRGSLHYTGQAFDLRTRDLRNTSDVVGERLRAALGSEFDVVVEDDHIHVEFQPKENRK